MEKFDHTSFYEEIDRNKRKSFLLLSVFFIILFPLILVISLLFGGLGFIIMPIVTILIIYHMYHAYNYGDQTILKAVNAQPADAIKHRYLIDSVEGVAIAAGIPAPKVYVMESEEINAFATGKDPEHASITFTTGALNNLKRDEIEGVVGHEVSHIVNFDIKYATLVAALVGIIAILSYVILRSIRTGSLGGGGGRKGGAIIIVIIIIAVILAIFAPLISRIVQASVSRKRELLADATGVKLTRYPEGLASALEKIKQVNEGKKMDVSEGMSHLFISDPSTTALDRVMATHPPLDERISILRSM